MTGVSLVATCAHQLLYSLPNWKQLVLEPVAASNHSGNSIAANHMLYGLVTALHNYVQVRCQCMAWSICYCEAYPGETVAQVSSAALLAAH